MGIKIKKEYSFWKTVQRGVIATALFAIPVLLNIMPDEILNLTLGGALMGLHNFIKFNWS